MIGPSSFQFDTRDPHEVAARLQPVTPPFRLTPMRAEFRARARVAALPHVGLFDIRINYGNVVAEPMCDFYSINVPLGPGIEWRIGSKVEAGGSGGIRVGVPGEEFNLRFHHAAPVLVANIDARAVHDAASEAGFSHDARREISLSCPEGAALFRVLTIQWRDALRAGRVPANDTDLGDIEQ
ncbi:MAG: hypothetical protein KJN97_06825, partial [Deltaproteobacteria bacterium]|nr:hypothetical protein [Deltaproteobacteria bacterium]